MLARRPLPLFVLPGEGGETGPATWWQRREMVVALVHTACPTCARLRERLTSRAAPLVARDAAQLVIALDAPETSALARRLADALALAPGEARVVVADRYGEVFGAVAVHGADADRVLDEVEAWLDHIQQQCPE